MILMLLDPKVMKKEDLLSNYDKIMDQIKVSLPESEVYVMAYYPITAEADFGLDNT